MNNQVKMKKGFQMNNIKNKNAQKDKPQTNDYHDNVNHDNTQ